MARGAGVLRTRAPLVSCTSLSGSEIRWRPSIPQPWSPAGSKSQTSENSRHGATALRKGGATAEPASRSSAREVRGTRRQSNVLAIVGRSGLATAFGVLLSCTFTFYFTFTFSFSFTFFFYV